MITRRWIAGLLLAACAVTGCGVPTEHGPRRIPADAIPQSLVSPTSPMTVHPTPGPRAFVFLIGNAHLVPVVRQVAQRDVTTLLQSLLAGPTPAEAQAGLRSALGSEAPVLGVKQQGAVATVDLGGQFARVGSDEQLLAIAQLVYTLTDDPLISAVAMRIDGTPIAVPRADGTLTDKPVTRQAYRALLVAPMTSAAPSPSAS